MAYSYGGLGSYGGGYTQQQNYQPQQSAGLAGYGQSMSSEQIDLNNVGLNGYTGYSGVASSYGSPYNTGGAAYGSQYHGGVGAYGSQYAAAGSAYGSQPYGSGQYQGLSSYAAPYPQVYGGGYGGAYASSYPQSQVDTNDPQLQQQIEQIVSSLTECRRPMLRRQVITVPANCPGRVTCITRRLPTPPPDVIERITVIKPPRDVVNLCIEKPCQPGPCFQQREICGKPRKPLIQPRVVSVPPRSNPCAASHPQPYISPCAQQQPQSFCGGSTMHQMSGYAHQPYYAGMNAGYNGYSGGMPSGYGYANNSYFGNNSAC